MLYKGHLENIALLGDELFLMPLKEMRWYNKLTFFYKVVYGLLTGHLQSYVEASFQDNYSLRSISAGKWKVIPSRTKSFKKTFFGTVFMNGINLNQKLEIENLFINSKDCKTRKFFI